MTHKSGCSSYKSSTEQPPSHNRHGYLAKPLTYSRIARVSMGRGFLSRSLAIQFMAAIMGIIRLEGHNIFRTCPHCSSHSYFGHRSLLQKDHFARRQSSPRSNNQHKNFKVKEGHVAYPSLALMFLRHNIQVKSSHIPGHFNEISDSLSRFQWARFKVASPECRSPNPSTTRIHPDLESEVSRLIDSSVANSKRTTYNQALSSFNAFLKSYGFPNSWPPSLDSIINFIAYLYVNNTS